MNFEPKFTIGDIVSGVGLIIASVGLFLNWWQLRKDNVRKRAEFIINVFNQYLADSDTVEMFYKIEYSKFEYPKDGLHGSHEEIALDKLLRYFEKIAALYEMKTITLDDLTLVEYELLRINQNTSVQSYFKVLDGWAKHSGMKGCNFASVRKVASILEQRNNPAPNNSFNRSAR